MAEPRTTIVIVYPYKFTEGHYRRFEVAFLAKHVAVEVWDTGYWVHRKFVQNVAASSADKNIVAKIGSFLDLLRAVRRLGTKSSNSVVAITLLRPTNLRDLICLLAIRWRASALVEVLNRGVPGDSSSVAQEEPKQEKPRVIRKLITGIRLIREREYARALRLLHSKVAGVLTDWLSIRPTHRILAGRTMEQTYRQESESKGIAVSAGSSWDFSNSLAYSALEESAPIDGPYAVLLDSAGATSASDANVRGVKPVLSAEQFYPALAVCLDRWEHELDISVVVAAHPRTKWQDYPEEFGFRKVYHNRTESLVKHCEFVITRFSAAVSYAVIYNKPIVCIYNEQMRADATTFRYLQEAAKTLGVSPINVDDPPSSIAQYLSVNKDLYRRYTADYLTTVVDPKPNYRVILEDIMGQGSSESNRWRE